jgi:hypothetical protein
VKPRVMRAARKGLAQATTHRVHARARTTSIDVVSHPRKVPSSTSRGDVGGCEIGGENRRYIPSYNGNNSGGGSSSSSGDGDDDGGTSSGGGSGSSHDSDGR